MRTLVLFSMLLTAAVAVTAAPQPPSGQTAAEAASRSDAAADREALAIAALEGLMSAPPERALPLLRKVLAGNQSEQVKSRALFVLGQLDLPEAHSLLLETARGTDTSLQAEAIRAIGIGGNDASLDALAGLYAGNPGLRETILQAYLIADRKDAVYQIARAAKSESELEAAVRTLGAMEALTELRQLGEVHQGSESLVQAYAIAGDLDSLRRIAADSGPQAVAAVRGIGIIGTDPAKQTLRELYRQAGSAEVKEAALQGLLIADDEDGVLALYRSTEDATEKRTLLRTLSVMGGDAALEAIDAALQGDRP